MSSESQLRISQVGPKHSLLRVTGPTMPQSFQSKGHNGLKVVFPEQNLALCQGQKWETGIISHV